MIWGGGGSIAGKFFRSYFQHINNILGKSFLHQDFSCPFLL